MRQRTNPAKKKPPSKRKPGKNLWNSLRNFLAKNQNIITLIFMLLTIMFWIYSLFCSSQVKPQPRPRFEIEQAPSSIPVQPANRKSPPSRPA